MWTFLDLRLNSQADKVNSLFLPAPGFTVALVLQTGLQKECKVPVVLKAFVLYLGIEAQMKQIRTGALWGDLKTQSSSADKPFNTFVS